jgi:hypothetical protein
MKVENLTSVRHGVSVKSPNVDETIRSGDPARRRGFGTDAEVYVQTPKTGKLQQIKSSTTPAPYTTIQL